MSAVEENLKRINQKLQQLLKQYQALQKENGQLKTNINTLTQQRQEDALRIMQLEQQAGILKSAAGKMEPSDKKAFEKHIDLYIKQIDRCIGILSE